MTQREKRRRIMLKAWIDGGNNRSTAPSDQKEATRTALIRYDAAASEGGLLQARTGSTRTYDAENRMKSTTDTFQ